MNEDLFGSAMNICSKINSRAKPNGRVIGESLFSIVKGLEGCAFVPADGLAGRGGQYGVYHVENKERRNIINQFESRRLWVVR
jgi:class 3 adenylate cyclase